MHAIQRRRLALPELPDLQPPVMPVGPLKRVHIDLAGPFESPLIDIHGVMQNPEKPVKAHAMLVIGYHTKAAEFCTIYSK